MKITDSKSFHLEIGEPVIVAQKATDAWGHSQFPLLRHSMTHGTSWYRFTALFRL